MLKHPSFQPSPECGRTLHITDRVPDAYRAHPIQTTLHFTRRKSAELTHIPPTPLSPTTVPFFPPPLEWTPFKPFAFRRSRPAKFISPRPKRPLRPRMAPVTVSSHHVAPHPQITLLQSFTLPATTTSVPQTP